MVRKSISYLSIAFLLSPLSNKANDERFSIKGEYVSLDGDRTEFKIPALYMPSDSETRLDHSFEGPKKDQTVDEWVKEGTNRKEEVSLSEHLQRTKSDHTNHSFTEMVYEFVRRDNEKEKIKTMKEANVSHIAPKDSEEENNSSVSPMRPNKASNEEGDNSNYISTLDTVDTKYRGMHPLGKLIKYTLFLPVVGLWEFHCRIQDALGNKPKETVVHFGPDSDSSSSSNGIKSMSMSSSSSSPSDPVKFVKSPNTSDEDTIFSDVMDADELNMNRIKYKVIYDSYCQERAQREAVQAKLSPAMQREARNSNLGKELLQRKYADAVIDMIQLENPDSEINYSAEWKGYVMEDLTSYYRKNFKALEDVPSE